MTRHIRIHPSWREALAEEWDKPYFGQLAEAVHREYAAHECYPPARLVFEAFNLCPFDRTKVVIIGQDPYHEQGQAMGLSFSVPQGVALPPSLGNIFRELQSDLGVPPATHGDLRRWAEQGVLLLNASLSVRAHQANSHKDLGWHRLTDAAIQALGARKHVVYMLWGNFARSKKRLILPDNLILEAAHPSPLSANRGGWFGTRHFSQCNEYLKQQGEEPINW